MKLFIVIAFMFCGMQNIKAQNSDKMETTKQDETIIAQAIENYYFNGLYTGDTEALRQIFLEGTLLFGDIKGQPYAKTLDEYLDGVQIRQSPKDSGKPFKGEIISVKVVNSIAIAELRVEMYDFLYYDMLSFHRLDGKWLIVNKMLTDVKP